MTAKELGKQPAFPQPDIFRRDEAGNQIMFVGAGGMTLRQHISVEVASAILRSRPAIETNEWIIDTRDKTNALLEQLASEQ